MACVARCARADCCITRRHSAVSFIANERGLPNEAHFEPGGLYVAVLREPRARYLSQYLHLKLYGEAYLRVRVRAAWRIVSSKDHAVG